VERRTVVEYFSQPGAASRVCVTAGLSPRWGSVFAQFLPHGLRRGLQSYAALRLLLVICAGYRLGLRYRFETPLAPPYDFIARSC
jgi:hypothetical protein